jgi:SAM-dependent methyltransferase
MSHPEQLAFFAAVALANRSLITNGRLIEIGSYDVNGSSRSLFPAREYVGVDLMPGPGVDLISFGHEVDLPDGHFDGSLSGECFEHDPHWQATFMNMARLTRPGGIVAFTCASRGRPEHGTVRSGADESPGTQAEGIDYYRNLTEEDFRELPLDEMFSSYRFWYLKTSFDLYFAGIRRGGEGARLPEESEVARIGQMMSAAHRVARLPLRLAVRVLPPEHYQRVILPYWRALVRVRDRFGSTASLDAQP